jgi:hypothetical protein
VNGRILGVVVNDVPRKSDRYGYATGYGYHSYTYSRGGNGHARKREIRIKEIPGYGSSPASRPAEKRGDNPIPDKGDQRFPLG